MALGTYKPTPVPNQKPSALSGIPWWGWVAGVGVVVVIFLATRGSSSSGVTSSGNTSADTQALSDLESSLQQLLAQSGSASSGGTTGGSAGDGLTSSGSITTNVTEFVPPTTTTTPTQPAAPSPASSTATSTATNFGPSTRPGVNTSTPQQNAIPIRTPYVPSQGPSVTPETPTITTYPNGAIAVSGSADVGSSGTSSVIQPKGSKSTSTETLHSPTTYIPKSTIVKPSSAKPLSVGITGAYSSPTTTASKTSSTPYTKVISPGGVKAF